MPTGMRRKIKWRDIEINTQKSIILMDDKDDSLINIIAAS